MPTSTTPTGNWVDHNLGLLRKLGIPGVESVADQVKGLARRIGGSEQDLWTNDDARNLQAAIETLPAVIKDFGVDTIQGRPSWEEGARLVLSVTRNGKTKPEVLKIGNIAHHQGLYEGAVLQSFGAQLPQNVPKVLQEKGYRSKGGITIAALAMEQLGPQLSGFAHNPPLTPEQALEAAVAVARLLRQAHQAEIPTIPGVPLLNMAVEVRPQTEQAWRLLETGELRDLARRVDYDALMEKLSNPDEAKVGMTHGNITGEKLVKIDKDKGIAGNLALRTRANRD